MKSSNRIIRYHSHGSPLEVLTMEEIPLRELGPREVRIEIQVATIHPSDIGLIQGSYGRLRELPAIGGREGAGKVVEVGRDVKEDVLHKVVAVPDETGAWQEYCQTDVDNLILLPALVPYTQLAVALLNPMTAWRLLNDFEYLREGDVIIQNAGNSAVGVAVVQFARQMGISCLSLVRSEPLIKELKAFGATEVWLDNEDVPERVAEFTDNQCCAMALNSVGGKSALRLAKSLKPGGVHVTFGAMNGEPIRFPTRNLIFDDVRFVGFWLDRWKQQQTQAQLRNALEDILHPLAMTELKYPIDSIHSLENFTNALKRNAESRFGKVLLARDVGALKKTTN